MVRLTCTVRGCGEALSRDDDGRAWRCPRGHAFDIAKSGYVNLLQPQDKRAKEPGDSKEVVAARRRLADLDLAAPLVDALAEEISSDGALLDVGCGEGSILAALCRRTGREGWGLDLSTPAIEAAARRHREPHWVIANGDRALPFAAASFATVLSVTARRHAAEFARVLAPGGRALIVVPGADDQRELREAVLGAAPPLASGTPALEGFALSSEREVTARRSLPRNALLDLLAITYRGQRASAAARAAALDTLEVTLHWHIAVLARRGAR